MNGAGPDAPVDGHPDRRDGGTDAPLPVTWESPLFDLSGYAAVARSIIVALDGEGVPVRARPMWGGLDVVRGE
jgi:hypothetical protein